MQAWNEFLLYLDQKLGKETVDQWLRTLTIVRFDACNLYLEAENQFQKVWFEEHVRPYAKAHFKNLNSHPIKIHFLSPFLTAKASNKEQKEDGPPFKISPLALDSTQTFSNFLYEEKNKITVELCKKIAPGSINPYFFFGPPGSGKTHLLMACANRLEKTGLKVFFVHAETFTEHVVQAIRNSQMQQFRAIYRNQQVLILDDIHTLAHRLATQEELFHTFNALHGEGKQIILSGKCTPHKMEGIEPRLTSRFEWGIVLEIHPLSKEKFVQVLRNKAYLHRFSLSEEIISFLIEEFPSSSHSKMRALEALLLRYSASTPISLDEAKYLLRDLLKEEAKAKITSQKILSATATYYGIRPEDILGKSQSKECVTPRKLAMFLCRDKLHLSYAKIGQIFKRDHSTVLTSIKHVENESGTTETSTALIEIQKLLDKPIRE